ncbi:MAG TPA: hypothetical protein VGM56_23395, partial [Byssovorax sp.]
LGLMSAEVVHATLAEEVRTLLLRTISAVEPRATFSAADAPSGIGRFPTPLGPAIVEAVRTRFTAGRIAEIVDPASDRYALLCSTADSLGARFRLNAAEFKLLNLLDGRQRVGALATSDEARGLVAALLLSGEVALADARADTVQPPALQQAPSSSRYAARTISSAGWRAPAGLRSISPSRSPSAAPSPGAAQSTPPPTGPVSDRTGPRLTPRLFSSLPPRPPSTGPRLSSRPPSTPSMTPPSTPPHVTQGAPARPPSRSFDAVPARGRSSGATAAVTPQTAEARHAEGEKAFERAKVLLSADQFELALPELRRANELLDGGAAPAVYLAWVELRLSSESDEEVMKTRRREAKRLAMAAVRADRSFAFGFYVIGRLAMVDGDEATAMQAFEHAHKRDPQHLDTERHLRLLARRGKTTRRS